MNRTHLIVAILAIALLLAGCGPWSRDTQCLSNVRDLTGCVTASEETNDWLKSHGYWDFPQVQPATSTTTGSNASQQQSAEPAAPTPTAPALGANGLPRRESGQNNTIAFNPGEMVYGWRITFSDGRMCDGGQCFVTSAPLAGTVTSGVVNPWSSEIVGLTDSIFTRPATLTEAAATPNAVPYNIPPQPQVGHPSLYLETGVPDPYGQSIDAHTKHWVIELLPGTTAIIGGFTVDGVENGVYKAVAGPGVVDTVVTDGFVAVTTNEWANAEFCFRVNQAIQFNWAHQTLIPLPGWNACP